MGIFDFFKKNKNSAPKGIKNVVINEGSGFDF